jgi:hypothetical protein
MTIDAPNSPGLSPHDFHSARAAISTEGVKGLFLLNGGGALALLAFLQAVWDKNPALAKLALVGISIFAFGALLAGFVNFLRYHTSLSFQSGETCNYKMFKFFSLSCQYLSLVAFAVATGVLVIGAWRLLP